MTIHIFRLKFGQNLCGQDLWDTRQYKYYASDCKLCREEYKLKMALDMEHDNLAAGRSPYSLIELFSAADG